MTNQEAIKTIKAMLYCYEATEDTVCNKVDDCVNCKGHTTTEQEIDALKKAIESLVKKERG